MGVQSLTTLSCLTRTRRAAVIASSVVAVLAAAVWLSSQFYIFTVRRSGGSVARVDSVPEGQPGSWTFTRRTWSLMTFPHQLRLIRSEYVSAMQHADESHRFEESRGWFAGGFSRGLIRKDYSAMFEFQPPTWRVMGIGVTELTTGGQLLRAYDFPYWLLIIVFGTPFAILEHRRRTLLRRERRGQCIACGYQLDAAMTMCPECNEQRSSTHSAV